MGATYLLIKFLHVLVAIIALGTSAGLGMVLEFYGSDPAHGSFVLRAIERMVVLVVVPGYVLMLATGWWMANLACPFTTTWIRVALGLWGVGGAALACSVAALRKQRSFQSSDGCSSASYRRAVWASRVAGGAFGVIVVAILALMVFKP
jgi:uncharacterized membrane protein